MLALCCDIRIATPSLKFGFPIARTVGNCLSVKNYARLAENLGAQRVRDMVFSASLLSADALLHAGTIREIVPEDALHGRAQAIAAQVMALAPLTLWATRTSLLRLRDKARGWHCGRRHPVGLLYVRRFPGGRACLHGKARAGLDRRVSAGIAATPHAAPAAGACPRRDRHTAVRHERLTAKTVSVPVGTAPADDDAESTKSPHAAPAVRACCPRGAFLPWGGPTAKRLPRCARCAGLLPRGAFALGGPAAKEPHAAPAVRACCPRGGFLPWGGPAAKRPHAAPAVRACCLPRGLFALGGPAAKNPTLRPLCGLVAPEGLFALGRPGGKKAPYGA